MTRAAIYARASLDATGEQLSVTRQVDQGRQLADLRAWTVVGEYVDNSISASDKAKVRPQYNRLVEDFEAGLFDALIVYDLDRLTRLPVQLEAWIDAAEDRGLIIATSNGEADLSTDGGRLFARIKAAVARSEIERKGARQRSAAVQRSELGRPPLGVRLTGYTAKGELIEHEAEIVRKVFARFSEGDSIHSITAWLNTTEVKPRHSEEWNPSSVNGMLHNQRYCGRAIYRGKPTGKMGNWTPLVDEATFDLIQAKLSDPRRRTQHGTDRKWLGSGLYVCDHCDRIVTAWTGQRYQCKKHFTRSMTQIDKLVIKLIRGRLGMADLANLLEQPQDETEARLLAELKALRGRLAEVEADYDSGLIDGRRFATANAKIEAEIIGVEAQLSKVSRTATAIMRSPDPVAAFDNASLMLRRATIQALCQVRLRQAPRGRREFDPSSVVVRWNSEYPAAVEAVAA